MRIALMCDVICPKCGSEEMHPDGTKLLIRAYKVDNWSQCLVCAGYYDHNLNVRQPVDSIGNPLPESGYDSKKGWFK